MKKKNTQYFHEIDSSVITGKVVILDIDGTLVCSSRSDVADNVIVKIRSIEENNTVYIYSNNYNGERSRAIAKDLHIPYIPATQKKPHPKILSSISQEKGPFVMIGDKYLTDELFARFTHNQFIHIKRYTCDSDRWTSNLACAFDDMMYALARLLHIAK